MRLQKLSSLIPASKNWLVIRGTPCDWWKTHKCCVKAQGTAMVLPTALRHRAISWYHHYLQHPGATRLEETLRAAMYWRGMRSPSVNMSKTVTNAKSINGINTSMASCPPNW